MKLTRNGKIATGVASAVAGTVLVGSLIVAPSAGADVLPEPVSVPEVPTEGGVAGEPFQQWGAGVNQALTDLDQGKKNEDGLRFHAGQEDVTTDSSGRFRLCFNDTPIGTDYEEPPLSGTPGTETCPDGVVTFDGYNTQNVSIEGVRSLDDKSFPDGFTTAHHQNDGTVGTALDNGQVMANRELRITWLATLTPATDSA